ncbi:MAG: hypothetical protein RR367_04065 [Clostridia bacterium]
MGINAFPDFCKALLACGFSMGGGSAKGIYAVIPYGWEEQQLVDSPIKWHTGDPETDPWEWRMRVLEERTDIAYAKVFFRTSGYITSQWYPHFLAVRRKGETFEEAYRSGAISHIAKRIYDLIEANGKLPLHAIKAMGGFQREEHAKFESALVELQMRMFITMCGRAQKVNSYGQGYGWSSTVFTTVEAFWRDRDAAVLERGLCSSAESYDQIRAQVLRLNPAAEARKIDRLIKG